MREGRFNSSLVSCDPLGKLLEFCDGAAPGSLQPGLEHIRLPFPHHLKKGLSEQKGLSEVGVSLRGVRKQLGLRRGFCVRLCKDSRHQTMDGTLFLFVSGFLSR